MKNLFNFAKKDFFIFASTYIAIILLVLLCLFPVCRAFEVSEQKQALAEIRDYASSMLGELDLQESSTSLSGVSDRHTLSAAALLSRSVRSNR